MNIPKNLIIVSGGVAPDGGSVFLDAFDDQSRQRKIVLDWSDMAQGMGMTALDIDGMAVPKRTTEEERWLEVIAAAMVPAPNGANSPQVNAGLVVLRDDLVAKVRSATHDRRG